MFPVIVNLAKFAKVRDFSSFADDISRIKELGIDFREYCFDREKKEDLVDGFHIALRDPGADLVWLACGGLTTLETFPLIDWDLVKNSGKSYMGLSDFTHLAWRVVELGGTAYYGPGFKNISKYFPDITDLQYFKDFLQNGKPNPYTYEVLSGEVENLNKERIIGGHLGLVAFMLANHPVDLSDRYLFLEYHYVPGESLPDLGYWVEQLKYVMKDNLPKGFIFGRSMFYEEDGSMMDPIKVRDYIVDRFKIYNLPMAYLDHFRQIVKFS